MTTDTARAQVGEGADGVAGTLEARGGCECAACKVTPHASDCAVHNEPAMPAGPCSCGAAASGVQAGLTRQLSTAVEAIEQDHDPLCMAVLRGKECTCGVAVPLKENGRG